MVEDQRIVLVVEHDWRIRRLVRANLEALKYRVREAASSGHALDQLRCLRPHLVLVEPDSLDMEIAPFLTHLDPGESGHPLPVIVMSAEPPNRQCLDSSRTASYLKKPFSAAALLEHVQRALGDGR
jgi:DNA-binding response OmpR family regulator